MHPPTGGSDKGKSSEKKPQLLLSYLALCLHQLKKAVEVVGLGKLGKWNCVYLIEYTKANSGFV
jgi:hypothetical protein